MVTFNGGLDAIRYSPLTQIAPRNVASIVMVGEYTITDTVRFQTGPVMIGKTLYFTTAFSTYAIDAVTGKLRWLHKFEGKGALLDNNRGVAYDNGKYSEVRLMPMSWHLMPKQGKYYGMLWQAVLLWEILLCSLPCVG